MMTPRKLDDETTGTLANVLQLAGRYGLPLLVSVWVLLGATWIIWYLASDFKDFLASQTQANQSLLVEQRQMRVEYAEHEAEHVRATEGLAVKIDKTNTLLESAKEMMAPAARAREEMAREMASQTKVLEEIRDRRKPDPGDGSFIPTKEHYDALKKWYEAQGKVSITAKPEQ